MSILRFCPEPGCRELTAGGPCAPHAATRAAVDNARRHAKQRDHGRDTAHWRNLSVERRALAGGLCELRLEGCRVVATSGHLDARLEGQHELATIDDVLAACSSCHGRVDAPRATAGSRA